ncbi:MAG: hypothetical protein HY286_18705 [Planctomycetes bacterium]|nr:hypothetical protein [Planctomycetota bacterium]
MNAWILDDTGKELVSFHAGDAISDVLARDGRIVFTYFDEGILGRNALGQDAITVFDANGKYVGGYRSKLKDRAVPIHDCYAACWDGKDQIAFSAYNEFSLVRLNISTFEQIVFPTPIRLHGSSAISTSGPTASFYSPYDEENELFSWDISNRNGGISDLGQCNGRLRGLEGGRFILIDPISFTIVSANTIIKAGNES